MNEPQDSNHCHSCHADLSPSAALTSEGQDYIYYFCSQDCLEKWREEEAIKNSKDDE